MRALRPALAALLLGVGLTLGPGTAPRVALGCSCVAPQPLARYAGEDTVILSGTVTGDDGDGVAVAVQHWFAGTGAAAVVVIAGDFGNGASCGLGSRPPVGSTWIGVAWRQPDEDLGDLLDTTVQVSICSPFADLATPEGAALLQEATATFGEGEPVPADIASPGTVDETPAPAAPAAPAIPSATPVVDEGLPRETVAAVMVGGVLVLGIAVLGVVLLVGLRGRRAGGAPPG
jgi:hypothetical protein